MKLSKWALKIRIIGASVALALPLVTLINIALVQPVAAATCETTHTVVGADGRTYSVNPDNWGGGNTCFTDYGSQAGFSILSQNATPTGNVLAYPNSGEGCSDWGVDATCTAGWVSPKAKGLAATQTTSMSLGSDAATDKWDYSDDLWFGTSTAVHPNTELMIFFNEQNLPVHTGAVEVTVDNTKYWYTTYTTTSGSNSWTYVQYRLVTPKLSVTNKTIGPVVADAIKRGVLPSSDYLLNASCGFELWQGGTGLRLNSESFKP